MAKYDYNHGIPDQAAPDDVKETMKYGNEVCNFIANEWFFNNSGVARFYDTREEFERLRLYARGTQSTAKYKRELAVDGDLSFLNLDWEPVPIIPKFVDLVVNKKQDQTFDVVAKAMDPKSNNKRMGDLAILKGEMENKEDLVALQEQTGVKMFENDYESLPESKEELELYMDLNYKQKAEIAAEVTVNHVLKTNNYDAIKKRLTRDLTEIGVAVAKHDFCPQKGVRVEYVDPSDVIYSYTEDPDFKDCYYFGEIKRVTVSDLKQMFPNLTPEQMRKARQAGASHYDYHGITYDQVQSEDDELRESNKVELMFFAWKTSRTSVYKIRENRKGGKTAVKRDEYFEGPKHLDAKFEKVDWQEEVVYQGVKVLGDDDLLLKWELQKNMIRPKSSDVEVKMPYLIHAPNFYKGRYDSVVKRITKYADQIQLTYLKIQQVVQKVVPPGMYIDVDGLAEINMGDGSEYGPKEALNLFYQTGSIIGRSLTQDGDPNRGAVPVQELPGSDMRQLQGLVGAYQFWIEQMRAVTGVNEAIDATSPHPDTLVGVQEQQIINSNVATRGILDGIVSISERMCDAITLRMQDIFEFHPLSDNFKKAVGRVNAMVIEELKDLHLKDFGIMVELEPDDIDKQFREQNIQQALAQDKIDLSDAIDIRAISNIKIANQLLKIRQKKKQDRQFKEEQENIQAQADANAQAAQAKAQADAQTAQMKGQIESQVDTNKSQMKIQELQAEMEYEKEILLMKHQLEMELLSAKLAHEDTQNDKNNEASMQQANAGSKGSVSKGSLGTKSNTIDSKIKGRGLLGN